MTTRRVFLGDIHMGDERGVDETDPSHPYSWFYKKPGDDNKPGDDRPAMLGNFLKQYCVDDPSVQEVVVVGDLFDEWVCPAEFYPTDPAYNAQQLENIVNAAHNQAVIDQLRALATQERLKYLTGNHDMLTNGATLERLFPGIKFVDGPDGHGVYKVDGIWAEHGHWYGLFNAPYPAVDGTLGNSILPLGFFITRVLAQEALIDGSSTTLGKVIGEWLTNHILSMLPKEARDLVKNFVPDKEDCDSIDDILVGLFDTLAKNHGKGQPGAKMNGYGGMDPDLVEWSQVTRRYSRIFSEWSKNVDKKEGVGPVNAINADNDNLGPAANQVLFNHRDEAKIVIFGHTHFYECTSLWGPRYPAPADEPFTADRNPIYANVGAWENATPRCTFVETEFEPDTRFHNVRLREWKDGGKEPQPVNRPDLRVLLI